MAPHLYPLRHRRALYELLRRFSFSVSFLYQDQTYNIDLKLNHAKRLNAYVLDVYYFDKSHSVELS